jgi:hypothetical protein
MLQRMLALEATAFLAVVAIIWLDESLDLPRRLFHAPATPFRLGEALLESCLVVALGIAVVFVTSRAFRRIEYLESLVVMCAWCRRVREGSDWLSVETFLERQHHAHTSHGICEECAGRIAVPPR